MEHLTSSVGQSYAVLGLSGLTSLWIMISRPKLSTHIESDGKRHLDHSPPATLHEAGTSPAISSRSMTVWRALVAVYILYIGGSQLVRMGTYVFKFYTIWNWWLLGIYFSLAALASAQCWQAEARGSSNGSSSSSSSKPGGNGVAGQAAAPPSAAVATGAVPAELARSTSLSKLCHALYLINSSTVIIVDVVCWTVLYPMLARGPQTPETQRIIQRLLLTYTSYNQHGFNAVLIFTDLFLNRHRLPFHAVGPLGLWSFAFAVWAHVWHAMSGKWLYPFMDTSKPWAPGAYLGLYLVHWAAFGLVTLLYRIKLAAYGKRAGMGGKEKEQ